tara:strand:+ start:705 stop:908 length:204 start_codon:yes stop_codon:yes gene_type:complete
MKVRAILLIDLDIDGSFKEVAEEQVRIEAILEDYKKSNPNCVGTTMDIKERRGVGLPDLSKLKLKGK